MKRFIFSAIALAAVVTGCTKGGILESPIYDSPISFEPYTGRTPVTKATEANEATIKTTGFHVTGFQENAQGAISDPTKPYMNKDVNFASDKWGYEGAAYWPESGTLSFVAYGLNVNGSTDPIFVPKNVGNYTEFTYTVPNEVANQKDLLISDLIKGKSIADNGPVQVTLKHVLSKVGFKVATNNDAPTTPSATDVKVTIKNITLNGVFKKSGDVNLTATTAAITPGSETINKYSLFDSEYSKGATGTGFNGFITKDTGADTPVTIYRNTTFDGDTQNEKYNNKTIDVPARTNNVDADRFMMIMPGVIGDLATQDVYDIDGDGDKEEMTTSPYIEVIYQLTDAEEQIARVPLLKDNGEGVTPRYTNWDFKAGTAYEFIFKVSTTAVGFTAVVEPWKDSKGTDNSADSEEYNLTPEID